MPLPHFLCIGAQKAGTTWLNTQLQSHPRVWIPPVKELQYFSHLYVPQHRKWTTWHIRASVNRSLVHHVTTATPPALDFVRYLADLGSRDLFTDAWYRGAYDRPAAQGKVLGDITPEYCTIPEAGIRHVRDLLGTVKIIYIIRDPFSRALSQFRMNVARARTGEPNIEEWRSMVDQWEWDIVNRGDYRAYVPRWKAFFAPEDMLFIPYRRISKEPEALMRDIESFLGLPAHNYPRMGDRIHETPKIDVPEEIAERLRVCVEGQTAFIEAEFGEAFAAEI